MDKDASTRKIALYELTDGLLRLDQPKAVAEHGLFSLIELLGAKKGYCILKTSLTQGFELAAKKGFKDENFSGDEWLGFCERPKAELLDRAKSYGPKEFSQLFGDIAFGCKDRVFVLPILSEEEVCGVYFIFGCRNCVGDFDSVADDAEFLVKRVGLFLRGAMKFQEALGLAYIDSLTDLYNARYLPMILEKRLLEARKSRQPLSLLFLDMDNFREVNTLYGHQAGGKALVEAGWILQRFVRANDSVIRYGGDEFTVVLPEASAKSAREIAERIRKAIKEHVFLRRENKDVRLTVSIGVATFPDDAATPEALLHLADQAMYRGKETTRDAVYSAADHNPK